MSDERLREAERRWKESGSVEDEARYLLERVRAGTLTQERLELAAYCGHHAATGVTTVSAPVGVSARQWIGLMPQAGRIRAAVIAARAVLPKAAALTDPAEAACAAAHDWITSPTSAKRVSALEASARAESIARHSSNMPDAEVLGAMAAALAARAAGVSEESEGTKACQSAVQCAANALAGRYDADALTLRSIVGPAIVGWALRE